jgi:hypothetical protein
MVLMKSLSRLPPNMIAQIEALEEAQARWVPEEAIRLEGDVTDADAYNMNDGDDEDDAGEDLFVQLDPIIEGEPSDFVEDEDVEDKGYEEEDDEMEEED